MNDPNHIEAGHAPSATPAMNASDADAEPRPLEAGIVIADDAWSEIGGVEAAIAAASAAVGAHPSLMSEPSQATVALDSDSEVAAMNGAFRGKPKPTNVLSFPAPPLHPGVPKPERRELGDIILARETVIHEAAGMGIPVLHHVQHLVVHGLLHLLGYDHETDREAEVMEALETGILAGLGISDPYAPLSPETNNTTKEP